VLSRGPRVLAFVPVVPGVHDSRCPWVPNVMDFYGIDCTLFLSIAIVACAASCLIPSISMLADRRPIGQAVLLVTKILYATICDVADLYSISAQIEMFLGMDCLDQRHTRNWLIFAITCRPTVCDVSRGNMLVLRRSLPTDVYQMHKLSWCWNDRPWWRKVTWEPTAVK